MPSSVKLAPVHQRAGCGVGVEVRSSEKGIDRCCGRGCSAEAESAEILPVITCRQAQRWSARLVPTEQPRDRLVFLQEI
jgi:hypothetical protein